MTKLMLVTPTRLPSPPGGRAQLSLLHRRCLSSIAGEDLLVCELPQHRDGGARAQRDRLRGYLDGLNPGTIENLLTQARQHRVEQVFLDGSNLGRLARAFKQAMPKVRVLTFFHNVEARFFLGSLRTQKSVRALGVLLGNFVAERMAVRQSDRLITLSERDSLGLRKLYGRSGTDVVPLAIEDKLGAMPPPGAIAPGDGYALFVGGAFYANLTGMDWYASNVAPRIGMKTLVVGRGFERVRAQLERSGNVEVIGQVEDLGRWYAGAKVVIAPIFDGSGMKTKTAEALMFGKRVVGTAESFSGYEAVADRAGWVCEGTDDFVRTLRSIEALTTTEFDPELRGLYERHYSYEAIHGRLAAILDHP
jgi:glycosyltransferase involved in cell wall biosynthesis